MLHFIFESAENKVQVLIEIRQYKPIQSISMYMELHQLFIKEEHSFPPVFSHKI